MAVRAEGGERDRLRPMLTEAFPRFADVQRDTPGELPVISLSPAGGVVPVTDRGR